MDHNMHPNAPLHYGAYAYSAPPVTTPPQNHWVQPTQSHSLKRALSESDCDDLYSEESSKEQISPSEPGSCQLMSRKKRRGVIEKKRRDRINSSLSELKRIVPSAYEKQGSAKLEKAEILQLTVEYLKSMHSKGMDALSYDPQRFAMDYHLTGFRECAAEVARYLVTIEGMDIQDPLRMRLMSHLQYFMQQRELSAKSCSTAGGWATATTAAAAAAAAATTGAVYQPNCAVTPYQTYPSSTTTHASTTSSSYVPNLPAALHPYPALSSSPNATNMHTQQQQHNQQSRQQQQQQQPTQQQQQQQQVSHITRAASASNSASNESLTISHHVTTQQQQQTQSNTQQTSRGHATQQAISPHDSHHPQQQQQQQQQQHYTHDHTHQDHASAATYIELSNAQPPHASHRSAADNAAAQAAAALSYGSNAAQYAVPVGGQEYNPNSSLNYVGANGSKPYRPWGAEMAY